MIAHLIISQQGFEQLGRAGISVGWLSAWLRSAGADSVQLHLMESDTWKRAEGWQVFYAQESLLMRIALHHGRRIRMDERGVRGLAATGVLMLSNPDRKLWHYHHGGSLVLLLPLGDIAYQRQRWLALLNDGRPLAPLCVWLGEEGGSPLEPGLRGAVISDAREKIHADSLINDGGYLPEEYLFQQLMIDGLSVRFAESCTGGGLSERFSRQPGASKALDGSWVVYSNAAKHRMLGVPGELIEACGAVSREVVEAMATSGADKRHACVAVSGIAGPEGESGELSVGVVWAGFAIPGADIVMQKYCFSGSRAEIRACVSATCLARLACLLAGPRA